MSSTLHVTYNLLHEEQFWRKSTKFDLSFMWSGCPIKMITNFNQQSPSWDANSRPATHDIPRLSWNQKVFYCVHKPTLSYPISESSILILSPNLKRSVSSLQILRQNCVRICHLFHKCNKLCPSHPPWPDCMIYIYTHTHTHTQRMQTIKVQ
jgi:hypothetical protein